MILYYIVIFCFVPSLLSSLSLIQGPITITHDTTLDGCYHQHTLPKEITIASGASLTITNAVLHGLTSHSFAMADETSHLIISGSTIVLDQSILWRKGQISFHDCCNIKGPHTFHFNSDSPCTVLPSSTLIMSDSSEFYYNPSTPTNTGFILTDRTSTLMLVKAHLHSGLYGLLLTKGTIIIAEECSVHADNPNPRCGIFFGSGKKRNDNIKLIFATPRSNLFVQSPHLFIKKKRKNSAAKLMSKGSEIAPLLIASLGIYLIVKTLGSADV